MGLKRAIKKLITLLLPVGLLKGINAVVRRLAAVSHHLQFVRQWRMGTAVPHFFDPFIDLYWKWETTRNPMSWERGIFGLLAMKPGCRQLDLCCGEGFHTHRFYSGRAGSVVAVDYDKAAIAAARSRFQAPNIDYRCADIRSQMPEGPFDNITWDAGMEYFAPTEIGEILVAIRKRLAPGGVFSGYCVPSVNPVDGNDGRKFAAGSPQALGDLLHGVFPNVVVLRTMHVDRFEDRTNCYFFAGEGPLPLTPEWTDLMRWPPPRNADSNVSAANT